MPNRRSALVSSATLGLGWVALQSCGSPANVVDVTARDDARWTRALRVQHDLPNFFGGEATALEFHLSHLDARDELHLESGEAVRIDRRQLTGPALVDLDFDVIHGALRVRVDTQEDALRFGGSIGLGWHDLLLEAQTSGTHLDDRLRSFGPSAGGHFAWEAVAWASLRADVENTLGFGASRLTNLSAIQAGVDLHPFRHQPVQPTLFLGWRFSRYTAEGDEDSFLLGRDDSEIELEVSGPLAEVGFRF